MKRFMPPALPFFLLFACSQGPVSLQPGMWETTIQFTSIDLPGAPPAQLAAMRQMMGQPQTRASCITPAEAANPAQELLNPGGEGNACQSSESIFAGGSIRVHSTCQAPGRGTTRMSMEGSYTATTMQATVSSERQSPPGTPGLQAARLSGTLSARRTGDCPA